MPGPVSSILISTVCGAAASVARAPPPCLTALWIRLVIARRSAFGLHSTMSFGPLI